MVLTRSQKKREQEKLNNANNNDSENDSDSTISAPAARRQRRVNIKPKKNSAQCKTRKKTDANNAKSKSKSKTQPKSKTKTKSRSQRKSKSKKSCEPQSPSSPSSPNIKRRLSGNSESMGTPPNKKSKAKRPVTPSKELTKLFNDVTLDRTPPTTTTTTTTKGKRGDRGDHKDEEDVAQLSRYEQIVELQEKLLTHEIDYTLIGRDSEFNTIKKFIELRLKTRQGDSFYICGSPGTGKTATMHCITKYFTSAAIKRKYKLADMIKINGMSVADPKAIYCLLYQRVFKTDKPIKAADAKNKLEKFFVGPDAKPSMYVVIIDEMDGLLGASQQQVLYHLFGWTKRADCRLILFGIANSIDLTDRFLPRLKQRNFEPTLLIFESYKKQQLMEIIKYRVHGYDCFDAIAIDLCATKVAKMYGDVRKTLEICRNALNILLHQNDGDGKIERIGFLQMKETLSHSFESPLVEVIRHLPNHQKTIMVLFSILLNKISTSDRKYVVYNRLEQFYDFMARKYSLPKTSSREFNVIVHSLMTDNIVQTLQPNQKHKIQTQTIKKQALLTNDTKLQLMTTTNDLQFAIQNDEMLRKLLQLNIVIPLRFLN